MKNLYNVYMYAKHNSVSCVILPGNVMNITTILPTDSLLAGYYGDGFNAIIVFAGCYLPDKRRRDYHYVMDHLFLYVITDFLIKP